MKKRNRVPRGRQFLPRSKAAGKTARRKAPKRRQWTFERLEDRHYLSANPLLDLQVVSLSNDTAEGALAIWMRELEWAARQSSTTATGAALDDAYGAIDYASMLRALPNDPMFPFQWHLLNTGQKVGQPEFQDLFGVPGEDINVVPVWNMGITGEGVLVAVIDSGVQRSHPDLVGNVHPTLRYNAINGTNNANPSLIDPGGFHGTAVAGLIGATWNNLGEARMDAEGNLTLDRDGNPVLTGGGVGVAPNVTLVPIHLLGPGQTGQSILNAFQWSLQNGIDITNNSWGPPDIRQIPPPGFGMLPQHVQVLRDSVIFGRDGLGMIHVWASGNGAGPGLSPGFQDFGTRDSASYDPWVNSRYTIGVTGVFHDGLYINADGTFATYPEAGASVLVAAPTGSNVAQDVADDTGQGSGLFTTDLVGDFGANAVPLPSGFDPDRDYWPDPDYTSRFNGTSGSAPIAAGVIALMLEANPNLTYRDVQEILVRSARQNAQFEFPASGGLETPRSTWQTNQIAHFRNPDPFNPLDPRWSGIFDALYNPLATPNKGFFSGEFGRQFGSHYEPQPAMFTNGAGYTVSQGYGVYSEQIGYAHGVIDAELAVKMAQQWHILGQNINPGTERTFTTFVLQGLGLLLHAERMPLDTLGLLVPGGIGGAQGQGFIEFWNEYFADDPFDDYDGRPASARGLSYIDFVVPPSQAINVEWVEVKLDLSGPAEDLNHLRISLVSPEGTHSELNHVYGDPDHAPYSQQHFSNPPPWIGLPPLNPAEGNFVWTFSTNRHWGESTNSAPIIHPVTGEPLLDAVGEPVFRNWELHIENWSDSQFGFSGLEVVFHGKPIVGGTVDPNHFVQGSFGSTVNAPAGQRVQGLVGIDTNGDNEFNFNRYVQTVFGVHDDVETLRMNDVDRRLYDDFIDNNNNDVFDHGDVRLQEPFAADILVEAFRVFDGVAESVPVGRFLTGANGNYYFDLNVQSDLAFADSIGATFEYEIRITDPLDREMLRDVTTPAMLGAPPGLQYLPHYSDVWRISPDWFFAPERDNPVVLGDMPGEVLFDPSTGAPVPFDNFGTIEPVPMAVKNLNFLLKDPVPANEFVISGTVIADINGNGIVDGDDTPAGGIFVYWDANRNGVHDPGEPMVMSSTDPLNPGTYTMTIPASAAGTFSLGVLPPTIDWVPTNPASGVRDVFARPGDVIENFNFLLDPPNDAFPAAGHNLPGNIAGVVFNDRNGNGVRNAGEEGVPGFRVFVDINENGVWDEGEPFTFTTSPQGSYFLTGLLPGLHRIDIEVDSSWQLTAPALGFREVELGPGGTVLGVNFGVKNLADRDWGNLVGYPTLASQNGPSHTIVPGVHLGTRIFGSVDGQPGATPADNDGVLIVSNNGVLRPGENILQVTVAGVGLFLNAWMDINDDGDWNDAGEHILVDVPLTPGTHHLTVVLPDHLAIDPTIASRFRWGTPHLSYTGHSPTGEVEDYRFPTVLGTGGIVPLAGDFDGNGVVETGDYAEWKTNFGEPAGGSGGVAVFDAAAYTVWRDNLGATASASALAGGDGAVAVPTEAAPLRNDEQGELLASGSAFESLLVDESTVFDGPLAGGAALSVSGDGPTVSQRLLVERPSHAVAPRGLSVMDWFTSDVTPRERANLAAVPFAEDARLRDLVLAELADRRDHSPEEDAVLLRRHADEGQGLDELALAAVFDEETDWHVLN